MKKKKKILSLNLSTFCYKNLITRKNTYGSQTINCNINYIVIYLYMFIPNNL